MAIKDEKALYAPERGFRCVCDDYGYNLDDDATPEEKALYDTFDWNEYRKTKIGDAFPYQQIARLDGEPCVAISFCFGLPWAAKFLEEVNASHAFDERDYHDFWLPRLRAAVVTATDKKIQPLLRGYDIYINGYNLDSLEAGYELLVLIPASKRSEYDRVVKIFCATARDEIRKELRRRGEKSRKPKGFPPCEESYTAFKLRQKNERNGVTGFDLTCLLYEQKKELDNAVGGDATGEGFIYEMFLAELVACDYLKKKSFAPIFESLGFKRERVFQDARLSTGLMKAIAEIYRINDEV